jgi:hypothetical protein
VLIRGRVELWLNIGLRYRIDGFGGASLRELIPPGELSEAAAEDTPPPLGRLLALLELLHDLAQRAGVASDSSDEAPDPTGSSPASAG